MAAAATPAPGTKYGPCPGPCEHRDCAASRAEAAQPCAICGEPIGYGRKWWRSAEGKTEHEICTYQRMEDEA